MNGLLRCLTTLATVLHLAVGCCAHVSHAESGFVDRHGEHAAEVLHDACDAGHHTAEHRDVDAAGRCTACRACDPDIDHDCNGCRCTAMADTDPPGERSQPIERSGIGTDLPVIPVDLRVSGGAGSDPRPVLSALRSPLFERLLV